MKTNDFLLMKERLVMNNGALTAQSVGKEISSSRARMSMALMKHEKLIKISWAEKGWVYEHIVVANNYLPLSEWSSPKVSLWQK